MLWPEVSLLEKVLRPLAVYLFLLVALRLAGKRELGQMTPADLVVLLTISNAVQNAMIGNDNSLGGGLIGATTLLLANGLVSRLAVRWEWLGRWLDGEPTALILDGEVQHHNLRREMMTAAELARSLRKHGVDETKGLERIKVAWLEQDGSVTIWHKED